MTPLAREERRPDLDVVREEKERLEETEELEALEPDDSDEDGDEQ